jgi:hypothetical protein
VAVPEGGTGGSDGDADVGPDAIEPRAPRPRVAGFGSNVIRTRVPVACAKRFSADLRLVVSEPVLDVLRSTEPVT